MKICIIGLPRSRSSILLETISLHYGIPILGEDINVLTYNPLITPSTDGYKLLLKKLNRATEGVVRFHPLQLLERPRIDSIINFELFNFDQYDQIYFTFRESISDIIASEFVANKLKKYTYKSADELVKNINIHFPSDSRSITNHIKGERAIVKLKEYFKNNNIASQDLFYNAIPNFLLENFPNTTTFHVKTNYNYREIISNYDDILTLYNNCKL